MLAEAGSISQPLVLMEGFWIHLVRCIGLCAAAFAYRLLDLTLAILNWFRQL